MYSFRLKPAAHSFLFPQNSPTEAIEDTQFAREMDTDSLHKDLQAKLKAVESVSELAPYFEKLMNLEALKTQISTALDKQASDEKAGDKGASQSVLQSLSDFLEDDDKAQKKMAPRKVDDDAKSDHEAGGYSNSARNGSRMDSGAPSWSTSICYNCNGQGHFARECPMRVGPSRRGNSSGGRRGPRMYNGGRSTQNVRCYHCGKDGHFARDCPEESNQDLNEKCFRCNKTGHWARDCDQPRPQGLGGGSFGSSDACHRCGKEGHWARDCDLPYQRTTRSGDKCNRCGKEGHWARDCDLPRNDGYGQDDY